MKFYLTDTFRCDLQRILDECAASAYRRGEVEGVLYKVVSVIPHSATLTDGTIKYEVTCEEVE